MTIDCEASDAVMPMDTRPDIGVQEPENQRKGPEYEVASTERGDANS